MLANQVVMARYDINLPSALKRDAERLAKEQGVSLNQFILWSVSEKVGALLQRLDDSNFPNVTYRHGASGALSPVLRGTGIRVQTIVIASENMSPTEIAEDYDLTVVQVQEALHFYQTHRAEIDAFIQAEAALKPMDEQTPCSPTSIGIGRRLGQFAASGGGDQKTKRRTSFHLEITGKDGMSYDTPS